MGNRQRQSRGGRSPVCRAPRASCPRHPHRTPPYLPDRPGAARTTPPMPRCVLPRFTGRFASLTPGRLLGKARGTGHKARAAPSARLTRAARRVRAAVPGITSRAVSPSRHRATWPRWPASSDAAVSAPRCQRDGLARIRAEIDPAEVSDRAAGTGHEAGHKHQDSRRDLARRAGAHRLRPARRAGPLGRGAAPDPGARGAAGRGAGRLRGRDRRRR